jgi:septum formation protein
MLVLASQSPRRSEILNNAGIPFVVRPASVDETVLPNESAAAYVGRLAEAKALAAEAGPDETVLAADTAVALDHHILGKPSGAIDAARMLRLLSGRRHEVITGICLRRGAAILSDIAVTLVWFANLSDREIEDYVVSGEPMDKAGAYAIQGLASKFIEKIDGCYFNVVGLPIALLYQRIKDLPLRQ